MTCAPTATRTRDLPLRRLFHAGGQPAVFLVRAGLLVLWLQLDVSSFRPVLARGWHGLLQAVDYWLPSDRFLMK